MLDFDFSMAFQPIIDVSSKRIFAHEALVRGIAGEPAGTVFEKVHDGNRYRFDQTCRSKAIKLAAELEMDTFLSINFMPNAIYKPELCIRTTLAAAETYHFPLDRIIFEFTESEKIDDIEHLREIVDYYNECGFSTAIDDFGAGYAGLNLLAEIQTDIVKLDMALIRNIDRRKASRAIVKGVIQVCEELDTRLIAEGIESEQELMVLQDMGIELFQGFYFAQPMFEQLANIPFNPGH